MATKTTSAKSGKTKTSIKVVSNKNKTTKKTEEKDTKDTEDIINGFEVTGIQEEVEPIDNQIVENETVITDITDMNETQETPEPETTQETPEPETTPAVDMTSQEEYEEDPYVLDFLDVAMGGLKYDWDKDVAMGGLKYDWDKFKKVSGINIFKMKMFSFNRIDENNIIIRMYSDDIAGAKADVLNNIKEINLNDVPRMDEYDAVETKPEPSFKMNIAYENVPTYEAAKATGEREMPDYAAARPPREKDDTTNAYVAQSPISKRR